jgi:hypothetical protein
MAKSPKPVKPEKAGKAARPGGNTPGGSRSVVWLSGLACGVLAAVTPGTAVVAAALLAPGIVAVKLDQEPGRPIARTILTCGLAGCVHPIIMLWNAGQAFDTAIAIISDPANLGIAWSAAAAGWLMTQIVPLIVRAVLEGGALTRAARLRVSRAKIAEAWGLGDE